VESGAFSIEVGDSSGNLPLKAEIQVESTVKLPKKYDLDSIFMDLMADPDAKDKLGTMMKDAMAAFATPEEATSEAAGEAVSAEMSMAMMQYMPLRSMLGFSNGAVTGEMIDEMLKKMNE